MSITVGADPRPLVVWLAGVAWDGLAGTDRRLVEHLAHNVDVLWVDPPESVVRPLRARAWHRLRPQLGPAAPHVVRLRLPAPPLPYRPGIEPATVGVLGVGVRRALRQLGRTPAAVVGTSPHPRLSVVGTGVRVYHATDDFAAGAQLMGKDRGRFERLEAQRVREADVLAGVSPEITDRWEGVGKPTFVLPNGVDVAHYADVDRAPFPADVDLPGPVAGLVGQLSPRVDLALLEAVVDAGISLLLVGPRQRDFEPRRVDALLARPGVGWVGPKPFDELPGYLRAIDVGLTPYVPDDFNRASFPLKTLEYLAAGRGVVSTDLPAVRRLGCSWVRTADEPAAFVAAVRATLAEGSAPALVDQRRAFAARHDWSLRARSLLSAIGLDAV